MGRTRRPGAGTKASARLQRLLVVVPYVVRHPGSRLDDLVRMFDVERSALIEDLNLLFLTGLPPYGPGDPIAVEIVEDWRVCIARADYISRPVRRLRAEAL